jgi:hypothetical protein
VGSPRTSEARRSHRSPFCLPGYNLEEVRFIVSRSTFFGAETEMALMKIVVASLLLSISILSEACEVDASILCRLLRQWNSLNNHRAWSAGAMFVHDSQLDPNATTREPLPSNNTHNGTFPPSPSNHSLSPTPAWDGHNGTESPHNSTTEPPTPSGNHTIAPSPSNHTGNYTTISPTLAPSFAPHNQNQSNVSTAVPSVAPAPDDDVVPKMTFWGIVRKTVAWLIIIALSVLAFGACMSHRYRIYFFLRGVWYTILRMRCTQWVFRKLRVVGSDQQVDSGLNTIIFDSEMSDGLLLNENSRED